MSLTEGAFLLGRNPGTRSNERSHPSSRPREPKPEPRQAEPRSARGRSESTRCHIPPSLRRAQATAHQDRNSFGRLHNASELLSTIGHRTRPTDRRSAGFTRDVTSCFAQAYCPFYNDSSAPLRRGKTGRIAKFHSDYCNSLYPDGLCLVLPNFFGDPGFELRNRSPRFRTRRPGAADRRRQALLGGHSFQDEICKFLSVIDAS